MTDLLITTILAGFATTYVIEFIELITSGFFGISFLKKWLSLPLCFLGVYSQMDLSSKFLLGVPSATLIAIALSKWLNKPNFITTHHYGGR